MVRFRHSAYGAFSALRGMRDIFTLNTPDPIHEAGRVMSEAEAPGLWRLVHDVAARQHALVPDTIVIGMDGGFYVTEHPVTLRPGGQNLDGRTLYIPAPYLELLDEEEIVGVVGHELAHFVGEDTSYSRHFSPIYTGLGRALNVMGEANAKGFAMYPAFRLGHYAIERFDHAVMHWSRLREFEADRLSSAANGPHAIARSLVRISVIGPVVTDTLTRAFEQPTTAKGDLVSAMVDLVRDHGWPDVSAHIEDRPAHPTDTHPPTPQRIEALNLRLDEVIAAATRPAADPGTTPGDTLFADWLATRRTLSEDFAATARNAYAEHRANLESTAAAVGDEKLEIYENSVPMMCLLGVVAALFAAGAGAMLLFLEDPYFASDRSGALITIGVLGAIAAGVLWIVLILNRVRREPLFILSRDTITLRRLARPLRWLDIEAYQISAGGKLKTVFAIVDDVALPQVMRFSPRTQVVTKKRWVQVYCYGIRGMRANAFLALLDRYVAAAYARAALEKQGPTADPIF
ncbi:peptidase M48-like protein [Sphingomonas sp. PP-CE-3G-477]|nr:peptidase M48-like protein [Sphingomonas sp. PP-CE-3G-477]